MAAGKDIADTSDGVQPGSIFVSFIVLHQIGKIVSQSKEEERNIVFFVGQFVT